MTYQIINEGDGIKTVKIGNQAFSVSDEALNLIDAAIAGGMDAVMVLNTMARQISARSVKEFDAEKARKLAERERVTKAIAELKAEIEGYVFSEDTKAIAWELADARQALEDAKDTWSLIDLGSFIEASHGPNAGEYRWTMYPVRGEKVFSLVLSLGNDHPLHGAMITLDLAEEQFRSAIADELSGLVPEGLQQHVKTLSADVDKEGNISLGFDVKERKTRSGGDSHKGRRVEVDDQVFSNATKAGEYLAEKNGKDVKYPHKLVEAAVKAGTAQYVS